ncbi:sortase domain-containing protein [Streptomyces eurocidicus]|uniref:sortase domain-containing protein n=1 Tax=Streptomyces eurocidicus TaxID=66423 RepID=UPI0026C2E863
MTSPPSAAPPTTRCPRPTPRCPAPARGASPSRPSASGPRRGRRRPGPRRGPPRAPRPRRRAPPPQGRAGTVDWYRGGPQPGAPGAAVLVAHLGTGRTGTGPAPADRHDLTALEPGDKITVTRTDGTTAEFTVEDVSVYTEDRFDAHKVYGPRERDRAELRLVARDADRDRARDPHGANVVVSAYLTGAGHS